MNKDDQDLVDLFILIEQLYLTCQNEEQRSILNKSIELITSKNRNQEVLCRLTASFDSIYNTNIAKYLINKKCVDPKIYSFYINKSRRQKCEQYLNLFNLFSYTELSLKEQQQFFNVLLDQNNQKESLTDIKYSDDILDKLIEYTDLNYKKNKDLTYGLVVFLRTYADIKDYDFSIMLCKFFRQISEDHIKSINSDIRRNSEMRLSTQDFYVRDDLIKILRPYKNDWDILIDLNLNQDRKWITIINNLFEPDIPNFDIHRATLLINNVYQKKIDISKESIITLEYE